MNGRAGENRLVICEVIRDGETASVSSSAVPFRPPGLPIDDGKCGGESSFAALQPGGRHGACDLAFSGLIDAIGREAELALQIAHRCGSTEGMHGDRFAAAPDIPVPP